MTPVSGVAAVGECMIELSGAAADNWRMGFAGDTFNQIWALRALLPAAQSADYVTAFGDDPFSDRQRAFMAEHAIGTAASPVIPGARPGLYAITLEGHERSFTYWRADAAARSLADCRDALAASLMGRALICFSGITLAILEAPARATLLAVLEAAREGGSRIAFDPNWRPRLWPSPQVARDAIAQALALTDIALPTFPDEAALFGDTSPADTIARLSRAGVAEIVVKDGAGLAHVAGAGITRAIPAVPVPSPVDTTGAGDAFNGGYLAARLAGHTPAEAAQRAHRVAAAVVQHHGALVPFAILRTAFEGALTPAK
ncbi:sugar kinase [Pararhodobacter sp.]|uniref:sugar kinase n=1 Tax=Pararhodobacter sp. TaxID=2127056 RepID=UPI002FDCBED3